MTAYVLITFGFRSIFEADSESSAIDMALTISDEKRIHSFLLYNRSGKLVYSLT